jgi:hypothetical protein
VVLDGELSQLVLGRSQISAGDLLERVLLGVLMLLLERCNRVRELALEKRLLRLLLVLQNKRKIIGIHY